MIDPLQAERPECPISYECWIDLPGLDSCNQILGAGTSVTFDNGDFSFESTDYQTFGSHDAVITIKATSYGATPIELSFGRRSQMMS